MLLATSIESYQIRTTTSAKLTSPGSTDAGFWLPIRMIISWACFSLYHLNVFGDAVKPMVFRRGGIAGTRGSRTLKLGTRQRPYVCTLTQTNDTPLFPSFSRRQIIVAPGIETVVPVSLSTPGTCCIDCSWHRDCGPREPVYTRNMLY